MAAIAEEQEQLKARLQDAEKERDKTKSELHDIREELERTQSQLDEVLGELEQTHFELYQLKEKQPQEQEPKIDTSVKEELEKTKSQLQTSEAELGKTKSQLQETKEELDRTYSQLDQIMGELEESSFELHQLKEKGQSPTVAPASKEELEKCQRKLLGARNHLQQTQTQLAATQQELQTTKAVYASHVTSTLVNVLLPKVRGETLNVAVNLRGSLHQKERIASVAEYCVKGWGGDLIEIGCFGGEMTVKLAEIAKKYDRRIIALWEAKNANSQEEEYGAFLKNIEPYKDVVDVIRLEEGAIGNDRELCFALVDGSASYDACLKNIETVAGCEGIIAVDDVLWSADVERAFQEGAKAIGRGKLHLPLCREGYLVPSA